MAASGWGYFALYGYSENLKYPLLQKCQANFQIILQKHCLGDTQTLQDSFKPWWLVKNMLFGELIFALWPWSDTGPLGTLVFSSPMHEVQGELL